MRLSTDTSDPGYRAWRGMGKRRTRVRIFVGGQEVKLCMTADTKRGYVLACDTDEAGKVQINKRRGTIRLKQMRGDVRIALEGWDG